MPNDQTPAEKRGYYIAAVLTESSQREMRAVMDPAHPVIHDNSGEGYHHVTLAYNTEGGFDLVEPLVGETVELTVVGYACDNTNEALLVTGVPCEKAFPHISLSWAEGGRAFGSNTMILEGAKRDNITVPALYGQRFSATVTRVSLR